MTNTEPTALQSLVSELKDLASAHEAKVQAVKGILAQHTDEALKVTEAKGGGYGRAAGYLLQLPAELRASAESEGTIRSNMNGGRYADAIGQVVRAFLEGRMATPYIEMNARIIAKERTQSWH